MSRHHSFNHLLQKGNTSRNFPLTKEFASTLVKVEPASLSEQERTLNCPAIDLNKATPKHRQNPELSPKYDPSVCDEWTEIGGLQLPSSFKQEEPVEPTKNLRYLLGANKAFSSSRAIAASSSASQNLCAFDYPGFTLKKKSSAASNKILRMDDAQHRPAKQPHNQH